MDRRTLLTIALCFLIFMGWQKLYIEPRLPKQNVATKQTTGVAAPPAQTSGAAVTTSPAPVHTEKKPLETRALNLASGSFLVGNGPKVFNGWNLKSYRLGISPEAAEVDLKSVLHEDGAVELAFERPDLAYVNGVQGTLSEIPGGYSWTYEDARLKVVREVRASDSQATADVTINAQFKEQAPAFAFVSLTARSPEGDPEEVDRQLIYYTRDSIERVQLSSAPEVKEVPTPVRWVGATNRYFLTALLAGQSSTAKALIQPVGARGGRASLVYPVTGNQMSIRFQVLFGPKELNLLRSVDPTLDHTVDFGWFTIVAYPLLKLMKGFYSLFHNWGVSIILLTLLVKLVTFPLTYKSMKSMKEMARLQPQLQKLRDKHKDDKEALNREMLTLMRSHGYNPAAGCFPILIQMPVFFALYRVLYSSIELLHAPFVLWIHDLSAKDPYYVTPILMTITMYIQQKLTPNTATDPAQQKMLQFMPVIFGVFMLTLPSGLTIYMLVNALASIVQQLIMNKKLNAGHVPTVATNAG